MNILKRNRSTLNRSDHIWGWIFVSVPLLGVVAFTLIPVFLSFYISLMDWTGFTTMASAKFIGFTNYEKIFSGVYAQEFLNSIGNTFFMMLSVPIGMLISFFLALGLNRKVPGTGVFRVIYYIPCIANVVAVTILFNRLFSEYGIINQILGWVKIPAAEWLYNPTLAKFVIIILNVWKGVGYTTLLYLAGLQGVNTEYYEAAYLDGAKAIHVLFKITLPLIAPTTFYVLVTGVMSALQLYTEPTIMFPYSYGKGPQDGTSTLMVLLYYQYSNQNNLGVASAIAWALTAIIMVVTAIQFYVNSRREKN